MPLPALLPLLVSVIASAAPVEVCPSSCAYASIGAAYAAGGSEIVVHTGEYKELLSFASSRSVTVRAKDASKPPTLLCYGGGKPQYLAVSDGASLTLEGLVLEGCADGTSRVLTMDGAAAVTLRGVKFGAATVAGNAAHIRGTNGGALTIEHSTFEAADASGGAGQVAVDGGVELVVTDSLFRAGRGVGGGCLSAAETSAVVIRRTRFEGCAASSVGGALYLLRTDVVLDGVDVRDSRGPGAGGVYLDSSDHTVTRSRFCGNSATANGGAAVARWHGATRRAEWSYNLFLGNRAGLGGALYAEYLYPGSVGIRNNAFLANQATGSPRGDGVYAYQIEADIRNNLFAEQGGYGVYASDSSSAVAVLVRYNAFAQSATFDGSPTPLGSNNLVGPPRPEPKLASEAPFTDCDAPLWPLAGSPLIGAGHSEADPTIGAFTALDGPFDADGDGHGRPADCDDYDPEQAPDLVEVCDGKDNDCVEGADRPLPSDAEPWLLDGDGDGFGAGAAVRACLAPSGYVSDGGDCDDDDDAVHPGADELCNDRDDDCDGATDDGLPTSTWYLDGDGDGFGADPVDACARPTGGVTEPGDCDDASVAVHPGADELCNDRDDDCDGATDDGPPQDAVSWYADADADGFGAGPAVVACAAPEGHVADGTDCDDLHAGARPGGAEVCDGLDNDCNGTADDGSGGPSTFYADGDGDGHGDPGVTAEACTAPDGFVTGAGDCDDLLGSVNPDAVEACNERDDDCDGEVDEGLASATWYRDNDGDGFGATVDVHHGCAAPEGFVAEPDDCVDTDPTIHPGAEETCNQADDDCDGRTDEDVTLVFHADADHDGFGDAANEVRACAAPDGYVADASDCDDGDPARFPGAGEHLNGGTDADCDGFVATSTLAGGGGLACGTSTPGDALGAVLAGLLAVRRRRPATPRPDPAWSAPTAGAGRASRPPSA